MFRVFPEALDPCFVFCALSRSSLCNAYQRGRQYTLSSQCSICHSFITAAPLLTSPRAPPSHLRSPVTCDSFTLCIWEQGISQEAPPEPESAMAGLSCRSYQVSDLSLAMFWFWLVGVGSTAVLSPVPAEGGLCMCSFRALYTTLTYDSDPSPYLMGQLNLTFLHTIWSQRTRPRYQQFIH